MARTTVLCCAENADPEWRWVESHFVSTNVDFEFARCPARRFDKSLGILNLRRLMGCFEAVRLAQKINAQIIVAHGPTLAAWCAIFARLFHLKAPIVAHSFNFTALPGWLKRTVFRFAFSSIERFVVYSQVERQVYSKAFGVPIDRFDFVHWGVRPPKVESLDRPVESGDYVSAIGGNGRDYGTLIEAARTLPEIRFILVVRPENIQGVALPANVSVLTNTSFGKAMNILLYSRFMVLPLLPGDIPCGHVTLVAAMHLGKAMVVTNSSGVLDYVHDGDNAIAVDAGSAQALAGAIQRLWQDRDLCRRLAENGRSYAAVQCAEIRIAEHFRNLLAIPIGRPDARCIGHR
jgi:glycosyltransferase involved in cell wall biosynthesis